MSNHPSMLNVLIVGAGNIGAFYDDPASASILTHAHAVTGDPNFRLVGFVDNNSENGNRAAAIWGGAYFSSIKEAFQATQVDVVAVTVPDEYHYPVLKELAAYDIQLVFTEKPLTKHIAEALEIKDLYEARNRSLLVNYTRRFVPEYQQLAIDIRQGKYGKLVTGSGYYGKGVLHNGSHMIDLLRLLIGDLASAITTQKVYDFFDNDPSVSGILQFENGSSFHLHAIPCSLYTVFEIDLFFEKGRIRMTESGYQVEFYTVRPNATLKNYFNLYKEQTVHTGSSVSIAYAYKNIYQHLMSGEPLICSAGEAYRSMQTCIAISETPVTRPGHFL